MTQKIANNARALLTAGISAVDTSIAIEVAKADSFPVADTNGSAVNTPGKDWFKAVLQDSSGNIEIVYVRTRAAGIAILSNVIRGQEGTTALIFAAGSVCGLRLTALDHENAIAGVAPEIYAATSKATPVDADELALIDSAASNVLKKLTWGNLKATLKTYFDTLYSAAAGIYAAKGANSDITSLSGVTSINGAQLAGMRNLLVNGNFNFNQREYVSATATGGANQVTLDRWRVITSGQNLSFTASGNGRIITAPAGGIEQVIEGASIGVTDHVINWTGTATCTVDGVAKTKGAAVTLTPGTDCSVKFFGGTVSLAQLEPGTTATPFEYRTYSVELLMCMRDYWKTYSQGTRPGTAPSVAGSLSGVAAVTGAGAILVSGVFPVPMRVVPTLTFYSANNGTPGTWSYAGGDVGVSNGGVAHGTTAFSVSNSGSLSAGAGMYGHVVAATGY